MKREYLKENFGLDVSLLCEEQQDNVNLLRLSEKYRQLQKESTQLSSREIELVIKMMQVNTHSHRQATRDIL